MPPPPFDWRSVGGSTTSRAVRTPRHWLGKYIRHDELAPLGHARLGSAALDQGKERVGEMVVDQRGTHVSLSGKLGPLCAPSSLPPDEVPLLGDHGILWLSPSRASLDERKKANEGGIAVVDK